MVTTGKNGSTGGQQAAYCLERAKGRFAYVFLGLLFLFLAFCLGTYGVMELGADKTGWELEDYAKLVIGLLACAGFLAAGVYECYTSLRDALQPGKSALANSIRSQFPVPEEAPDWQQLFAMVDDDLRQNGRWFGKVGIGNDWLLGDQACALARVRGVFRHYEIRARSGGGSSRQVIDLLLIDDRKNSFITSFQDVRDLDAVIQYLRLRIPAAFFGSYNDYIGFCGGSDDEWDRKEREFRQRQEQMTQRAQSQAIPAPAGPGFMLTDLDGRRTSLVTRELLAAQMERIAPGQQFFLTATPPIPAGMKQISPGITEVLRTLNCICRSEGTVGLIAILGTEQQQGPQDPMRGFGLVDIKKPEALEVMARMLESHTAPDVFGPGWQFVNVQAAPQEEQGQHQPPYLNITDGTGVSRKYERFSRRDVELAAEKVGEGSYHSAILWLPPRLIFLDAGDKSDARTTIQIALPKDGAFRTFREKTTGRQAAEWFIGCLDGKLPEGFEQWKEVTKEWEKRAEKAEKQKKGANKK